MVFRFFVDGSKNRRWRPKDSEILERAYDGYKKVHVFSVMVLCDLLGLFIRIEIKDKGVESDRSIYVDSDIYKRRYPYISEHSTGWQIRGMLGVLYRQARARRELTGRPCTVHTCRMCPRVGSARNDQSWRGVRV